MATNAIDTRARISWMWVYVMLNMIFADILGFMTPGNLQQIMAGHADSITITPGLLLAVAVVTQIPISMVVLTQVLPQRVARWANLVASVLTIVYVIGGKSDTPHYLFIAALETVGCLCIAWWAWKWRPAEARVRARELAAE